MSGSRTVQNDLAAHDVLRAAHHSGYRFPDGFPGYSAEISYVDPETSAVGAVAVRAPRDVMLEIDAGEQVASWIRQELSSMASHRWPTDYDAGDGRYALTFGSDGDDPLGRLLQFHDDPFSSSCRVREGRILQINRQMGNTRLSINILEHVQTADTRLLPTYFTVAYWDAALGRMTRSDAYTDRFVVVEGLLLPASRGVLTADDQGVTARELTLSDHRMLPRQLEQQNRSGS